MHVIEVAAGLIHEKGRYLIARRKPGVHLGGFWEFRVLHIAEFLAEQVREGKLRLKKVAKSATFHDPCQVVRRGGAIEAPREVLKALGVELREMYPSKGTNWC